jgi:hypothetical protein
MTFVSPAEARAKWEDGPDGLQLTIPGARRPFVTLFLLAWLGGWFFGERNAVHQLTTGGAPGAGGFLAFWLVGWTLGGAFVAFTVLWTLFGRERLVLRPDALVVRREVWGIGRSRTYDIRYVKDLRVAAAVGAFDYRRSMEIWGLGGGRIAFDYGAKTVYCAPSIDEAEAKQIVARLQGRNHLLVSPGAA